MKRSSVLVGLAVPAIVALAALSCVGDDPGLASGANNGDGGPGNDVAAPPGDGGGDPGHDDGGGDGGEAGAPPHVPVVDQFIKSGYPKVSYGFGGAIALSTDGNTLAVGSPGEDSAATGVNNASPGPNDTSADAAGAVFVFTRSAMGVWSQQAYVKASNTATLTSFGCSVSLSSDGNRLAVGAKGEDSIQLNSGAVYLYQRTGTTWAQIPSGPLKAGAVVRSAEFGTSVALSGDGNSLAVGSFGEGGVGTGIAAGATAGGTYPGSDSTYRGAVNVFTYAAGNWSQSHYIKPSIMQDGARFGASVALNGSGSVLIVGSQGENSGATGVSTSASSDTSATGAGAAYVFEKTLGSWAQTAYVKPVNTRQNARFGISVSVAANGQSFVVGSNYETSGAKGVNNTDPGPDDTTATSAGAAYVFTKGASAWSQTAYLKASNARGSSYFGGSVAMSLDGKSLIVGSSAESSTAFGVNNTNPGQGDSSLANAGAAYVYALVNGDWMQTAYLKSSTPITRASNFGSAVSITNGAADIAVGASTEPSSDTGIGGTKNDTGAGGSGAAFTFH